MDYKTDTEENFEESIVKLPKIDDVELKVFQDFMKTCLALRQSYEVTERLVEICKEHFTFYSIRSEICTEIWVYSEGIYVPFGKSTIRQFSRYMCGEKYKQIYSDEVIIKIEADTFIDSQIFFNSKTPGLIPVKNGLLNLKTRKLEDYNSKYILFNKIPITYDPKAKVVSIEKFFHDVAKDVKDVDTLYEMFGYCLYTDSFLEKAVMLLGSGRNGKTKLLTLLRKFLGEHNSTEINLRRIETDKFCINAMMNSLANLAGDISKKRIEDSSMFKELVGRDKISTARKFKDDIEFTSYAKQIFATNNLPQTDDISDGFWTKWVLIQFPNKFVPQKEYERAIRGIPNDQQKYIKIMNPHIIREIVSEAEMSGLLNKALDGLDRLFKNKSFTSSNSSKEIEQLWIRESSSFAAFALDCLQRKSNYYITADDMLNEYAQYCDLHSSVIEAPKEIAHTMSSLFSSSKDIKRLNESTERMWVNVKFKNELRADTNHKKTMFVSRAAENVKEDDDNGCQKILE